MTIDLSHISSNKIKKSLGFSTSFTIKEAIIDLKGTFSKKLLKSPLEMRCTSI